MTKMLGRTVAVMLVIVCLPLLINGYKLADYYNLIPKKAYYRQDFGIEVIQSSVDYNCNGVDDYTDILLGAKQDAENHPEYDSSYIADGGYPADDKGVCTDGVWRALKNAGYSLKLMVDKDARLYPDDYPRITERDSNIDFRRVKNLRVFFDKYGTELTTDTTQIEQWQPGDIVIFKDNKHIGVVSDKRNKDGRVYIIHNGGQPVRDEDYLKRGEVLRHYRFDRSMIDPDVLVAWEHEW